MVGRRLENVPFDRHALGLIKLILALDRNFNGILDEEIFLLVVNVYIFTALKLQISSSLLSAL